MGIITFNNIDSSFYDIQVESPPEYIMPERDYEVIHIPGRSGDIVIDKKSYKNVPRKYKIAVGSYTEAYDTQVQGISEWLHSASGYARLEDTYDPDVYRMAMYSEENEISNILNQAGRTTITFNCKPQRFLKAGEDVIKITAPGTIQNKTYQTALPIIDVKGTGAGVLTINGNPITIKSIAGNITINSEIKDIYSYTINSNDQVTLSKGFPILTPGDNTIEFSGGITSVEVIPKWWIV